VLALGLFPALAWADGLVDVSPEGVKAILTRPGLQVAGAERPDVTIVEYFDYNCPFCKRMVPTFNQLLATDKKLAVVYKDWPVLGEVSVRAARCALAAQWQGKYLIAHDALLSGPRLSGADVVDAVLARAGIDLARLRRDLDAHAKQISDVLARNAAEAQALELDGTPGILVGSQLMPGGAELPFIQNLITEARTATR
jgi:protein-disulfide isomerase